MKSSKTSLLVAALLAAPAAMAAPIAGLYNTGAGFAANAQDTHYALNVVSGSTVLNTAYGFVADNAGWPDGSPWIANGANSKWLTPTADEAQSFDPYSAGVYRWRLSFDLTGFDANTASFAGQWATDNRGSVLLNGTTIGTSGGFGGWSSFSASSGFNAGLNTLDFLVTNLAQNGGNPTGLRVEFMRSAVAPVPEPETYAMMLAGLGLMASVARRRRARG